VEHFVKALEYTFDPMPNSPKIVQVFYSWQSDLPDQTNRRAIRNALRSASIVVEEEFSADDLKIEVDEATRDAPGSPHSPVDSEPDRSSRHFRV
jgi:hypothetical protein